MGPNQCACACVLALVSLMGIHTDFSWTELLSHRAARNVLSPVNSSRQIPKMNRIVDSITWEIKFSHIDTTFPWWVTDFFSVWLFVYSSILGKGKTLVKFHHIFLIDKAFTKIDYLCIRVVSWPISMNSLLCLWVSVPCELSNWSFMLHVSRVLLHLLHPPGRAGRLHSRTL